MKLTAVIVACALALTPQLCDGGTLCWTVEADDKLAQVECEHLDERTYAHRGTAEYGFAVAVGAVFDGCVGLLLWTVDLMIFLVYWLVSWYVPSVEVMWRQAFMECVEVYVSFFDVNQPLLVPTLSTMAVISCCLSCCMLPLCWEGEVEVPFFAVCGPPGFMAACLLVLTVAVVLVPLAVFVIATVFLTFAFVVLLLLIVLAFALLFLIIFFFGALAFAVACLIVTLIGIVLMFLLLVVPMVLVMALTSVILGLVAYTVQSDRPPAAGSEGCWKHVKSMGMTVGKTILAMIELIFDFGLVNACFIVFSEISGIRFEYLRQRLVSSLLEGSPASAWLVNAVNAVESWAVAVGRLAPVLTEWMDMSCAGPNSLFAAAQLTMALGTIKLFNNKSLDLQATLNHVVMAGEMFGGLRTLFAMFGKVVLMKTLQILLQSSAYVVLFRPIAKAQCTFSGDLILAIIGHAILVVAALWGLYIAPQVLGFGGRPPQTSGRSMFDRCQQLIFGVHINDNEPKLSRMYRLLQLFFGYWSEAAMLDELKEYKGESWVTDPRRVESFLSITAEYLSMGLLLFPLGNFLQKIMVGFHEGFIMCPGNNPLALPESGLLAFIQKFLAVIRAIAIGVTVVVPDGAKLAFWIIAAVCTVGKTLCDDRKRKSTPTVAVPPKEIEAGMVFMTFIRPLCQGIGTVAEIFYAAFLGLAALLADAAVWVVLRLAKLAWWMLTGIAALVVNVAELAWWMLAGIAAFVANAAVCVAELFVGACGALAALFIFLAKLAWWMLAGIAAFVAKATALVAQLFVGACGACAAFLQALSQLVWRIGNNIRCGLAKCFAPVRGSAANKYKKGDVVEVWSKTKGGWRPGAPILEAYDVDCTEETLTIPAGALKVQSGVGPKYLYIMPGNVPEHVRLCPKAPKYPKYKKGDVVEVWSKSKGVWLPDATVLEAYKVDCAEETRTTPAGALKVQSSAGTKYVMPDDVPKHVRPKVLKEGTWRRREFCGCIYGASTSTTADDGVEPKSADADGDIEAGGGLRSASHSGAEGCVVEAKLEEADEVFDGPLEIISI